MKSILYPLTIPDVSGGGGYNPTFILKIIFHKKKVII